MEVSARLMRGHRQFRRDNGQSLVEFALVFPVFILIVFGLVDVGRLVYTYNTLGNAAREGARIAAVNQIDYPAGTSCNENMPIENVATPRWAIKPCVVAAAVSLGLTTSEVVVSYSTPTGTNLSCSPTLNVGCIATVTVSHTWSPSTPGVALILGSIPLSSTSQIPIERVFP
jgi:Flp pilus assembly protein TadG